MEKVPPKYRKAVEAQLKNISVALQARRKESGLTQEQLAESLDLAVMTIQFIEQQQRYPSLPVLFYICKAMDTPLVSGLIADIPKAPMPMTSEDKHGQLALNLG